MAHWMCTACGYYLQGSGPPDLCPSCGQKIPFNDVTCYRFECGGEQNLDPLAVLRTLNDLRAGPVSTIKPKPAMSALKAIPLVEILRGQNVDREDLQQFSFWAFSQLEILRGLSLSQREQIKGLGCIEHYESNVIICTEGAEARTFYLVEEGQVAVESQVARGLRIPIGIVNPAQAFGWSALVPPYVYTASVIALSRTRVLAIEQKALLSLMQTDLSLGFIIMQNVACIVATRLRTLERALSEILRKER